MVFSRVHVNGFSYDFRYDFSDEWVRIFVDFNLILIILSFLEVVRAVTMKNDLFGMNSLSKIVIYCTK